MTPLAHRIVRELTLRPKERTFLDGAGLLSQMSGIHCFEVSEVLDALKEMLTPKVAPGQSASDAVRDLIAEIAAQTSFLPAPKTGIEWGAQGDRVGFLLEESEDVGSVRTAVAEAERSVFCSQDYAYSVGLGAHGGRPDHYHASRNLTPNERVDVADFSATLNGVLAFVNSPRVIGRQSHEPHRGLEKKLRARPGPHDPIELHPWTEIKLQITPPDRSSDVDTGEGRLTGQKALHFCRSHLRIRKGRLEQVRAHWRGDPALGMRQSRYRLTNGKPTSEDGGAA